MHSARAARQVLVVTAVMAGCADSRAIPPDRSHACDLTDGSSDTPPTGDIPAILSVKASKGRGVEPFDLTVSGSGLAYVLGIAIEKNVGTMTIGGRSLPALVYGTSSGGDVVNFVALAVAPERPLPRNSAVQGREAPADLVRECGSCRFAAGSC